MRFADLIAYQAKLDPEKPAIVAAGSVVSFAMLEAATQAVAARLHGFGLPPGSIVGIWIASPIRHMTVSLAVARRGLVSAPFRSQTMFHYLPQMALILADEVIRLDDGQTSIAVTDDWFAPSSANVATVAVDDAADCRIFLSSGTTGTPKALVQTFGGLDRQVDYVAIHHSMAGECKRILSVLDLVTAWAFRSALAALANGTTMYFVGRSDDIVSVVQTYRCQYIICSVQQLRGLVRRQQAHYTPVPSLLAICTGGSIIPGELVQSAQTLLTARIILIYGSSEVGHSALEVANTHAWEDGVTGFLTPWTEMQVVDTDGQPLPPGVEGELRLRSDGQTKFGGAPAPDGGLPWFYPGDIGRLSPAGRLTVTGRTIDILNIGGAKMSVERVEHVLTRHPAIIDAGVIGLTDRDGLTAITAGIVTEAPLDADAVRDFVRQALPNAVPARIVRLEQIPRGDTGKVERQALRALLVPDDAAAPGGQIASQETRP